MATAELTAPGAVEWRSEGSDTFGSRSGDMTDLSTPSSTPPSLTHDTSRARFHVKDLSSFATCLENSAKCAFPTRGLSCSRYKSVRALLLMWENDELGIDNELDGLHQVFSSYGFDTETWLIPSNNPHLELTLKAANFVKKYESKDCLLIVYYGGHAAINSARQSSWYCKSDPEFASISLEWSAIQTVFEKAISDVLLLLDCCGAASAAPVAGRAITETIAACGWEAIAPIPGRWSFTGALIEVLDEWIDHSFSVAMLHSQVLSVLKHPQPERRGNKKRKVECRRTPVYIHTSAEPGIPSINLSRLRITELPKNGPIIDLQAAVSEQISAQTENPKSNPVSYTLDNLTSSEPTGDLKVPHVLISLALCEDQELELKACSEWLSAFPALAKYATVKGVYRSHSTLIIASVPVLIWDLLPENRACSFIGYVTSDNLLDLEETSKGARTEGRGQTVEANMNNEATKSVLKTTPSISTLSNKYISKRIRGIDSMSHGQEPDEEEEDEDDDNRHLKRSKNYLESEGLSSNPWLACPFFKLDPTKYSVQHEVIRTGKQTDFHLCAGPGFSSITRLKEHLARKHYQRVSLNKKREAQESSNIEKWNEIWAILFPDTPCPKTPWYDKNPSDILSPPPSEATSQFLELFKAMLDHKIGQQRTRLEVEITFKSDRGLSSTDSSTSYSSASHAYSVDNVSTPAGSNMTWMTDPRFEAPTPKDNLNTTAAGMAAGLWAYPVDLYPDLGPLGGHSTNTYIETDTLQYFDMNDETQDVSFEDFDAATRPDYEYPTGAKNPNQTSLNSPGNTNQKRV